MKAQYIIIAVAALLVAGCGTSEDRVAFLRQQTQIAQDMSTQADAMLPVLEAQWEAFKQSLNDPSITPEQREDLLRRMGAVEAEAAKAVKMKAEADARIASFNAAIQELQEKGEITGWDELQLYTPYIQEGIRHLPPPYNAIGTVVIAAATALGGAFAGKKKQESEDKSIIHSLEDDCHERGEIIIDMTYGFDELIKQAPDIKTVDEAQAKAKAHLYNRTLSAMNQARNA